MADDRENDQSQQRSSDPARTGRGGGGRDQGGREPGGFRIRLSDNEMRAARALQETFRLRSTVAALGFALRTTAQLLEEGKLDALVEQQRSQAPARSEGPRGGAGGRRDCRPDGRGDGRGESRSDRAPRVDPFARPSRPAQPQPVVEPAQPDEPAQPEELAPEAEAPPTTDVEASADQEATPVEATPLEATPLEAVPAVDAVADADAASPETGVSEA